MVETEREKERENVAVFYLAPAAVEGQWPGVAGRGGHD